MSTTTNPWELGGEGPVKHEGKDVPILELGRLPADSVVTMVIFAGEAEDRRQYLDVRPSPQDRLDRTSAWGFEWVTWAGGCDDTDPPERHKGAGVYDKCPRPAIAAINGFSGPGYAQECAEHLAERIEDLSPIVWVMVRVPLDQAVSLLQEGATIFLTGSPIGYNDVPPPTTSA